MYLIVRTYASPIMTHEEIAMSAKTLYDKLWDDHLVKQRDDGSCLIYIDRQLLHEVTPALKL